MADTAKKPNTIKSIGKKVANNGDANDYVYVPIGADSDNVDRPDGSTVEESLTKIETEKIEIIPVESLPESDIKIYPFVYALVKLSESKGTFYEYRNNRWIKYGNGSDGIWVGTKEQCVQDFDNIEKGTIVIIVNKKEDSGETHTHDYVCQITKEPTYSQKGLKTYTCFLCGESYTEEIPSLIDSVKPVGVIRIGENEYATWKDTITFNTYYKDNQTVTIEAADNETGVKEIAYYLSNNIVSDSDIGNVNWAIYNEAFEVQPNNNYIIYARITDNADNVTYICSDGIVMDNIPPEFNGLEDGGTYPVGTVLSVENGVTLTVNGEIVELNNGSYTFSEPMDNCILSLTDQAGNVNSIIIIIEDISGDDYADWNYSLDNDNNIIKLSYYNGNKENVIVYSNYIINGKKYKTKIDYMCNMFSSNPNRGSTKSITFNSNIDTINVTDMSYMFNNCSSLTNLDISNIDTSNVSNMEGMFYYCKSLINLDIRNMDTKGATNMRYMFQGCGKLNNIYVAKGKWVTNQASTSDMFYECGVSDVTYVD